MAPRVQIKRGNIANLPTSSMLAGEQFFTLDEGTMHVATSANVAIPVVPAVHLLTTLATVSGTDDLIMIHDASESAAPKAKKITFDAFKTALNIPASSADEKVAVASGGTAGYIWGSDGTDGVVRLNSTLSWTKDSGSAFVTVAVDILDCGTFGA